MAADPKYVRDLIDKRYFGKEIDLPDRIDFVSLPVSRVHLPPEYDEESEDTEAVDDRDNTDDAEEFYDTDDGMAEEFSDDDVEDAMMITKRMIAAMTVPTTSVGVRRKRWKSMPLPMKLEMVLKLKAMVVMPWIRVVDTLQQPDPVEMLVIMGVLVLVGVQVKVNGYNDSSCAQINSRASS
ncbi:hypothetical protein PF003_g13410 [Phytophthora fragariae]|nr:hypothetical protein PF003_g13410 [Phytophthora fragariae]